MRLSEAVREAVAAKMQTGDVCPCCKRGGSKMGVRQVAVAIGLPGSHTTVWRWLTKDAPITSTTLDALAEWAGVSWGSKE